MEITTEDGYSVKNIAKINIILGKNGVGKSTLLRNMEHGISSQSENYGNSKYITPERGGELSYNPNIEQNMTTDPRWLTEDRRKNQTVAFRSQSVNQFVSLELLVLREFEEDQSKSKFKTYIQKINSLLDNIEIVPSGRTFKIHTKSSNVELMPSQISSGESELISLGIECLIFEKECDPNKENILFLDEPDVHLHPDLQVRLMRFLNNLVTEKFRVIIATHSTAILGALEYYSDTNIAFLTFNQKIVNFSSISEIYKKVLPIFGAHPLSNVLNRAPIWLVEGEDDERVWQQALRSSRGRIKIYPCSVDGISNMNDFEYETKKIIETVYDDARGYSLRDRDEGDGEIDDILPIVRMKLACRACENLLLSDEVLKSLGQTWERLMKLIDIWLSANKHHSHYSEVKSFKDCGYDRKNHDIKNIRNDLMGMIESSKPWEVVVGKTISDVICSEKRNYVEGGILNYLGNKIVESLDYVMRSVVRRENVK